MQKTLTLIVAIITMLSCTENEARRTLTIDLNGTYLGEIYVNSLSNSILRVDTIKYSDGVYKKDITEWAYGFYRLQIDSTEYLDIVAEGLPNMMICGRRGYLNESTTNGYETLRLWQLQSMQEQMEAEIDTIKSRWTTSISALKDTIRQTLSNYRSKADNLLNQSEMLIVSIPILNIANGEQRLYDIFDDYEIFGNVAKSLKQQYPENRYISNFSKLVDNVRSQAQYLAINKIGYKASKHVLRRFDGTEATTGDVEGLPYIFYYTSDTCDVADYIARSSVYYRNTIGRVYVAVPNKQELPQRPNFEVGQMRNNGYQAEMNSLQPILMVVDAEGRIKKFIVGASYRDLNSVW